MGQIHVNVISWLAREGLALIGEQLLGGYNEFGERIRQAFGNKIQKKSKNKGYLRWGEVYWADITQLYSGWSSTI